MKKESRLIWDLLAPAISHAESFPAAPAIHLGKCGPWRFIKGDDSYKLAAQPCGRINQLTRSRVLHVMRIHVTTNFTKISRSRRHRIVPWSCITGDTGSFTRWARAGALFQRRVLHDGPSTQRRPCPKEIMISVSSRISIAPPCRKCSS